MTEPLALMTVSEAAQLLSMSERHVRRLVQERRIGFSRLGRCIRLSMRDVELYMTSARVEAIRPEDVWRDLRRVG